MNFEFNDEEKAFAESFRNFCKKEIEPYSVEYEENGEIPRSQFKKLAEAGFTGLLHEESYGGSNASYVQAMIAQEILAEYCGSTYFSVGASAGLFGLPVKEFGTEEQKKKYLPDIIAGNKVGS